MSLKFSGGRAAGGLETYSVNDVCDMVMALGLDPRPFKENAVEGADLKELTDVELGEYLGLKPLQIRKIRKKMNELEESPAGGAAEEEQGGEESAPSKGIFQKYQEQLQSVSAYGRGNDNGYGGGFNNDQHSSGFGGGAPSKFSSLDHRGDNFERPAIDYSQMKPCERGLAEGVYAEGSQEVAERNAQFEQEVFSGQSTGIDFDKYSSIPAEATGNNVPQPISAFDQAGFHPLLMENINLAKYKNPTPVQRYGVAITLAGRDMMACAQTGSGKTAAFLFPIISTLLTRGRTRADEINDQLGARMRVFPDACILCPTRELALQIYDEARKFTYRSRIHPAVVYGGADPKGQVMQIKKGCHILIATPGRLNQMVERGHISLSKALFFVMDEADRMLDMGFEPQIRQIVENHDLPKTGLRQTLMFSATFPREVQILASSFLHDYIFLTVGRVGAASSTIKQMIEYVEEDDKHDKLLNLLRTHSKGLSLVFVQTKKQADTLEEFVRRSGFPSTSLSGDRSQWEREEALKSFSTGKTPILVATDVAQRGLDIPHVNHVINFDMPANIDDYVHRIGRTGRVGNLGLATSFFNDQDTTLAADLVEILKEAHQEVPTWLEACATEIQGGHVRTRYKLSSRDSRGGPGPRRDNRENGGFGGGQQSFDSAGSFDSGAASTGGDLW